MVQLSNKWNERIKKNKKGEGGRENCLQNFSKLMASISLTRKNVTEIDQ